MGTAWAVAPSNPDLIYVSVLVDGRPQLWHSTKGGDLNSWKRDEQLERLLVKGDGTVEQEVTGTEDLGHAAARDVLHDLIAIVVNP